MSFVGMQQLKVVQKGIFAFEPRFALIPAYDNVIKCSSKSTPGFHATKKYQIASQISIIKSHPMLTP